MIDVIIPTYKPEYFLYECLNSLDNQTLDKDKYIVHIVINGSDEFYFLKINNWLNDFSFEYKVYFINESGVSNARNFGIENSFNDFLFFLDDDDIISENYLLNLLKVAKNNILAVSNFYSFTTNIYNYENYFLTFSKSYFVKVGISKRQIYSTVTGKLIHRNMVKEKRFNPNFKVGEDALFMFSLTCNISFVESTSPDCIYFRRIRNDSAITSKKSKIYYFDNALKQIFEYSKIYFKAPIKYSFILYVNRLLAVMKMFLINLARN